MTKVLVGYYFVAAIFLVSAACDLSNPWDYSHPAHIAYTIRGGFGGTNEATVIDENGQAELTHDYYPQKYVVHYQLISNQLNGLKSAFDRADFVALNNKYPQKHSVKDDFFYFITYTSGGATKTVVVEEGAEPPRQLEALLIALHKTNEVILQNPDAATLLISQFFEVKLWPFSDSVRLGDFNEDKFYFDNSELSRQLFDYLNHIDPFVFDELVFWEGDSLYSLRLFREGPTFEENIGSYFQVWGVPVRYWPADFGFALSDIPETGRILDAQTYQAIKSRLNVNLFYQQPFIFDELQAGGKAVTLALVSGRPE
jgi:hypothetical protein